MQEVLNAALTRAREEAAERMGLPSGLLMENAGAAVADRALSLASEEGQVFVLCGPGNNGGDGLVAARKLAAQGRTVRLELVGGGGPLKGEPERNRRALETVGVVPARIMDPPGPGDVVVDAVFGTGLNRAPEGPFAEAILRMADWRRLGAKLVAVDVPSGLQSDTGQPFSPCVEADATVTFGSPKVGTVIEPGASLSGELVVADIGLPGQGGAVAAWLVEESDVRAWIPKREANSHKGTFGHLLVISGSRGKSGAAAMCGLASLRAGAGLVTVATPGEVLEHVLAHAPELMGTPLEAAGGLGPRDLDALRPLLPAMSAVAAGPGIPRGPETLEFLRQLLEATDRPVLLDADALNALAGRTDVLKRARGPVVLTPHPGEMARLLGSSTQDVQRDRLGVARRFAEGHGVILVLKGARTLVALPDGNVRINPTGNPGMATGGTGDVLTGILGGLLAQGFEPGAAATAAVYVHGLAGDRMVEVTGQMGLLATDLLRGLAETWAAWDR